MGVWVSVSLLSLLLIQWYAILLCIQGEKNLVQLQEKPEDENISWYTSALKVLHDLLLYATGKQQSALNNNFGVKDFKARVVTEYEML